VPAEPPETLWHGTAEQYVRAIREQGLVKGARHDVHLSETRETASAVGRRHGRLVLLEVAAGACTATDSRSRGRRTACGSSDHVPPAYLTFPG
jgi:putative RNA 2'-phosphotransferase